MSEISKKLSVFLVFFTLLFIILFRIGNIAFAAEMATSKNFDIEKQEEGWWWYKFIEEEKAEDNKTKAQAITIPDINFNPVEEMKKLKYMIEYYKNLSILVPTKENIKNYLIVQKAFLERSEIYAQNYKEVVLANPELDFNTDHPISGLGNNIEQETKVKEIKKALDKINDKVAILFFFSGECSYCQKQAEILKRYKDDLGIYVLAVSVDGTVLPEFPNPKKDNGIVKNLNIKTTPSLYLMLPETNQVSVLAQGFVTADVIKERILFAGKRLGLLTENDLPQANKIYADWNKDLNKLFSVFKSEYKGNLSKDVENFHNVNNNIGVGDVN